GLSFWQHAADSAANAHYDRPAVLAAQRRRLLPDHPGNRHLRMPSGDQPVHFWREPLSALCTAATDAGFLIEKVIEPVPAGTMRERYPGDYEKLSREPGFLILRLLKAATPGP